MWYAILTFIIIILVIIIIFMRPDNSNLLIEEVDLLDGTTRGKRARSKYDVCTIRYYRNGTVELHTELRDYTY